MPDPAGRPAFSVVIPAHDEARVIDRLLGALTRDLAVGEAEIVVATNGCTDDTAARAGRWPGVVVVDSPVASKHAALNLGDATATVFPRLFIDADVQVSGADARAAAHALAGPAAAAAAPGVVFDDSAANAGVRLFYRHLRHTPWVTANLVGLGFYGVSEAGRARWQEFPPVIADDLYVATRFDADERHVTGGTFTVLTPRTVRALLTVRTRAYLGNWQLAAQGLLAGREDPTTAAPPAGLPAKVRAAAGGWWASPSRVAATWYLGLNVVAAVRARRLRATVDTAAWGRDETSRT